MHSYHDVNGRFPPATVVSKDGKPLYSWRVLLLPYLEQQNLYQQIHLNEPWDSEHNKPIVEGTIPLQYAPVNGQKSTPSGTYYQLFVGKKATFDGAKTPRIEDITDGTSNTIMIAEAGDPVPWAKPVDLPFDPDKPLPKLGGLFAEGYNVALFDGSVRFIHRKKLSEKTLRNAIMPNDGNVLGDGW